MNLSQSWLPITCLTLWVVLFAGWVAPTAAQAESKIIRIQTALQADADELVMLRDYTDQVSGLTNDTLKFEILPAGAIVPVGGILEAVDEGKIEAGFAWTHYWTQFHPASMLFGSPIAGAGVGLDNIAFLSWFLHGGGRGLYDELWSQMGMNVKGLILQPGGPEALGWFAKPIANMTEFRKLRFRVPPGIPGEIYEDLGIAGLALNSTDIVPAIKNGLIDAAEWCCPKPDQNLGLHNILKHYYLQGLHQVVVNADMYFNGDVWKSLTAQQRKALEVAADASLMRTMSYRIRENGIALQELREKHGVKLHDTPSDYFSEYLAAARKNLEANAEANAFFRKVWESQKSFAKTAVPFWANAQRTNANLGRAYLARED